ncbi:PACE efflux transporter [Agaribacterium haliotis]|uniref:PACE efflux transporter n=1 Tax=Agaribacterium haliotis TaxID=2013869 RepID=UPI000BB545D6|nr:PACE efflux transporter [Agaribacterium haliotis]
MSVKERIFHMLLFEAIALLLFTAAAVVFTGDGALKMSTLALVLSLIAMSWNYFFNWAFDRIYGAERIKRGLKLRAWHATTFELGMVILSFPVIMLWLDLGFWGVLLFDAAAVSFFFIYAIIYNWLYDQIRFRLLGPIEQSPKLESKAETTSN